LASAEQNERETYRVIVLSRDGTKVLLVPNGERRMLPSVEIPRWQRVAENLTAAVESNWGEQVVCLFDHDTDSPTDGTVNSYQAAEHLCTRSNPRVPTHWAPVSTLSQDSLADECDYVAIKQVTAVCNGQMGAASAVPFSRLGWFSELHNWIESVVEPIGFHVNGRFRQLNASPSFSLIRFETSGPAVWFKAVGEPNQREFPITCTLSRLFSSYLPNVLATRPDWNAWLTRESEGGLLGDEQESGTWERVAAVLAELQINSGDRTPAIAGAGARDLSVGTLRKQIRPFVDVTQQLMQQQPKTPPSTLDRKELLALGDRIGEAFDFLEALEIPETLGHLDLNPGNIVVSATKCVFLDWAEAYVGNPFLTFQYLIEHFRRTHPGDSSRESQVLESYAAPWSRILSRDAIHAGLTVAPLLAVFSYMCGTGLLGDGERLKQADFAGYLRGLARRMDREARAWVGSRKCTTQAVI
jgi:hypothetical protein